MDNEILAKVNEQVFKQFPYMKEITPQVKTIREGIFQLNYSGSVQTANGRTLPIIVNVVADEHGKIQKLTSSK